MKREHFFGMVLIGTPIKPRKGLELLNDMVGDKNRTPFLEFTQFNYYSSNFVL